MANDALPPGIYMSTPKQRALQARVAAHAQWGREPDRTARTAKARQGFMTRFEREARAEHPHASDEAITKMADAKMRAYFTRMALEREKAKAARKGKG